MWDSLPRNAMGKVKLLSYFSFAMRRLVVVYNVQVIITLHICFQVNKKELKKVLASDHQI